MTSAGRYVAAAAVITAAGVMLLVPAATTSAAPATDSKGESNHRPFSFGPIPVTAAGTYTNGQGGCPVARSFRDAFVFFAPGDGTMKITQPRTGDVVSGTIGPGPPAPYELRSPRESYVGTITGATAFAAILGATAYGSTARYSYTTAGGCTETYDASFAIGAGPPANPLDRIGVRATCSPRATARWSSHSQGDVSLCTLKATNTGQRPLYVVSFALPHVSLSAVTASNGGACTRENGFGVCKWTAGDFLPTQTRTVNVTTTPLVRAETTSQVCGGGNPQFTESYCVDARVAAPSADLDLLVDGTRRARLKREAYLRYTIVVLNNGPDTSPSAKLTVSVRGASWWSASKYKRMDCPRGTCTVASLAPGQRASVTMAFVTKRAGIRTAVIRVAGEIPDLVPGNNTVRIRTTITGRVGG